MYQNTNDSFVESPSFPQPGKIIKDSPYIEQLNRNIRKLKHDLFYLWVFLSMEGISEEAGEFLEEHLDDYLPML